jgi:subtilase family serine protease
MRPLQRLLPCLVILSFLAGRPATAQKSPSAARIVEQVDDNQLVTLGGNTHPAANGQNDQGRVSPRLQMSDLVLVLKRSPEQQAAFDALVASQYDSTSPNFHRWLEPSEIGAQFGPSLADIATISSWLTGRGFSVDEVSKDRMTIRFSGTAGQVERAFHTEIHNLSVKGEAHLGNMSDPQIPMALNPVVAGVKALHNFFPKPQHKLGGKATLNPETGKWQKVAPAAAGTGLNANAIGIHPDLGIHVPNNGNPYLVEDITPYDFAAIYNVSPLWSAATPIDGTGQTIAIVGTSRVRTTDVAAFRSTFGLPAGPPLITTLATSGTDPGYCAASTPAAATHYCTLDDQTENALDVEWSGAVAKNAQIVLVVSGAATATTDTVFSSANYIIQNKTANIMNVSYGECELGLGTAGNKSYHDLWQTAAGAGIAVIVATGDSGSPACDQGQATSTPYGAQYGLSVSGLASTIYDTAVGGTDLNWGSTAAPYWSATNNSTNGSSALGYMPEVPWNSTCTNPIILPGIQNIAKNFGVSGVTDTETACNFIAQDYQLLAPTYGDLSWVVNTVGAGGGPSNCINGDQTNVSSCTQGYPKPSWQSASLTGMPNDSSRDVPDVSFFASPGFLGSAYLICITDSGKATPNTCLTSTSPTTEPTALEIGGTSAASPAMAGVMALINQKIGTPQGNPNTELYALAAKQTFASCTTESGTTSNGCYFNDIDTGTIAMACSSGSPSCTVSHSGDTLGILSGYSATVGYDLATGLGTLNVANVVNAWTASTGTATATVTVTPAPSSIVENQTMSVTVAVSGASGTPTGTVFVTGGGFNSATQTLTSGSYTFTIPVNSLTVGSDTLTAKYNGDPTYATATGTATVTVTAAPKPTVTVTPVSSSINSGQSLAVTVALAGGSGTPTGTVTLSSGSYTSAATTLASGSAGITIPANSLSAGTDTLTASYSGDATYGVATGTASVTVTQSTFSLTASAPAGVNRGSSAASTITVNTSNNYGGTVTLSCALTSGPTNAAADAPTCSASSGAVAPGATGTATVSTRAATTSALELPLAPGKGRGLLDGGAVLALVILFGIPARRRSWRAMLGALVLMIALGSLAACGGGGGGGGGNSDPGTASGAYTFTVTGTGTPAQTTGNTTTFTVTVN